jgi:hypothetical protein
LDIWLEIGITILTMAIVEPFQSNCQNEREDSKSTLMKLANDSDKEDTFIVHMDNKLVKFECSPDGLYQYSVSSGYQQGLKENQKEDGASNLISMVAKNRQGYTILLVHRQ